MTDPNLPPPLPVLPLPYQVVDQRTKDADHLRLLSLFHYIHGGLVILFSSLFLFHLIFGIVMIQSPQTFAPPTRTNPAARTTTPPNNAPPPDFVGYMMAGLGLGGLLIGWTTGILTIVCGRCIKFRRRHTFTLIMAGVSCLLGVTGIALGVFTFIVLLRPSVKWEYDIARQTT